MQPFTFMIPDEHETSLFYANPQLLPHRFYLAQKSMYHYFSCRAVEQPYFLEYANYFDESNFDAQLLQAFQTTYTPTIKKLSLALRSRQSTSTWHEHYVQRSIINVILYYLQQHKYYLAYLSIPSTHNETLLLYRFICAFHLCYFSECDQLLQKLQNTPWYSFLRLAYLASLQRTTHMKELIKCACAKNPYVFSLLHHCQPLSSIPIKKRTETYQLVCMLKHFPIFQ